VIKKAWLNDVFRLFEPGLRHLPVDARETAERGVRDHRRIGRRDGHKLAFEVIAEGVESQDALRRVTDLGCDVAQGHFVSGAGR